MTFFHDLVQGSCISCLHKEWTEAAAKHLSLEIMQVFKMTEANVDDGESASDNRRRSRKVVCSGRDIFFSVMHVVTAMCLVHLYLKVYSDTGGEGDVHHWPYSHIPPREVHFHDALLH